MPAILKNNATSVLTTAITASDTALVVANGGKFPSLSTGEYFYATLISPNGTTEIIKATARVGNSMTIERAQDDSVAESFQVGTKISMRVNAATVRELRDIITPMAFGAVGDGVTDDTGPVKKAMENTRLKCVIDRKYVVNITSSADVILLPSDAVIEFRPGGQLIYTTTGWPMILCGYGTSGQTIISPVLRSNMSFPVSIPSQADREAAFPDIMPSTKMSHRGSFSAIAIIGGENVTVSDIDHEAVAPGIINGVHNIVSIHPGNGSNLTPSKNVRLTGTHRFNDFHIGILATGVEKLVIGDGYADRFIEVSTTQTLGVSAADPYRRDYAAPGHVMYITEAYPNTDVQIGNWLDVGTPTFDGVYELVFALASFKFRGVTRFQVGKLASYRRYGIALFKDLIDAEIDSLFFRSDYTGTSIPVSTQSAVVIINAEDQVDGLVINSIYIADGANTLLPLTWGSTSVSACKGVRVNDLYIEKDFTHLDTSVLKVVGEDIYIKARFNLSNGFLARPALEIDPGSKRVVTEIDHVGTYRPCRIANESGENCIVRFTNALAGTYTQAGLHMTGHTGTGNLCMIDGAYSWFWGLLPGTDAGTMSATLPHPGLFLVTVSVTRNNRSHARFATYLVTAIDNAAGDFISDAQQIGTDIVVGSNISGLGVAVANNMVSMTPTWTAEPAVNYLYVITAAPLGGMSLAVDL